MTSGSGGILSPMAFVSAISDCNRNFLICTTVVLLHVGSSSGCRVISAPTARISGFNSAVNKITPSPVLVFACCELAAEF